MKREQDRLKQTRDQSDNVFTFFSSIHFIALSKLSFSHRSAIIFHSSANVMKTDSVVLKQSRIIQEFQCVF